MFLISMENIGIYAVLLLDPHGYATSDGLFFGLQYSGGVFLGSNSVWKWDNGVTFSAGYQYTTMSKPGFPLHTCAVLKQTNSGITWKSDLCLGKYGLCEMPFMRKVPCLSVCLSVCVCYVMHVCAYQSKPSVVVNVANWNITPTSL